MSKPMPSRARYTGFFALPEIALEVPTKGSSAEQDYLWALLVQTGVRQGLSLPAGHFGSITEVLKAQWQLFIDRLPHVPGRIAMGKLAFALDDESLEIWIEAEQDINIHRLKPVIDALEARQKGLGWYVWQVLCVNANVAGFHTYDDAFAVRQLCREYYEMNRFDDKEYMQAVLNYNGIDVPDGKNTPKHLDELLQENGLKPNLPSKLLQDFDGHAQLLGLGWINDLPKSDEQLDAKQAAQWVECSQDGELASVVHDALALDEALVDSKNWSFNWWSHENPDDADPIGAMAFVVWDNEAFATEAAEHYETNSYNSGNGVEAFARSVVQLCDISETRLDQLAADLSKYLNCWVLYEKLLAHFPVQRNEP